MKIQSTYLLNTAPDQDKAPGASLPCHQVSAPGPGHPYGWREAANIVLYRHTPLRLAGGGALRYLNPHMQVIYIRPGPTCAVLESGIFNILYLRTFIDINERYQ